MVRRALPLLALAAFPAAAQAQITAPEAWIDERPLHFQGGCLSFNGQPACWDGTPPAPGRVPVVEVAPGGTLTLRFADGASAVTVPPGVGSLTQRDATTWALTLAPRMAGPFPLPVNATLAGAAHAGLAHFSASVTVTPPSFAAATLTRSVARAQVRLPAAGSVRAHVTVAGERRSAYVTARGDGAGTQRLRVKIRGQAPRTAKLVVRYTFPGGRPVEISQRLKA